MRRMAEWGDFASSTAPAVPFLDISPHSGAARRPSP
jgi:hypothetical protein